MNTPKHIIIDGDAIAIQPADSAFEYLVTTREVARGYGVGESIILKHRQRHSDELTEGKHFIITNGADKLSGPSKGVTNCDARHAGLKRGNDTIILWTKRGVIRLGFFIRSERAKRFRDAAEDLILRDVEAPAPASDLSTALSHLAHALAQQAELIGRLMLGMSRLQDDAANLRSGVDLLANRIGELERSVYGGRCVAPGALAASEDPAVVYLRGAGSARAARRGWASTAPYLAAVQSDLAALLSKACEGGAQAVLTTEELLALARRLGLFRDQLSPFAPKVALGILLTRLEGKTLGGVTITKHRLARQRRYILTRK